MTKKTKPRAPASFNVSDLVGEEETTPRQPKADTPSKTKAGTKRKTKPRAVRSDAKVVLTSDSAAQRHGVNELADLAEELTPPAYTRERQSGSWLKRMAVASFLALVSLGLALWIDSLVSDLFARADWLGWIAVGLTAILIGSLALMVAREIVGLRRMRKIADLRPQNRRFARPLPQQSASPNRREQGGA